MEQERLEYIDALRGFTMILVVFAHIETFMLSIDAQNTFISGLFQSFRMPLFFFISGFLSYKMDKSWDFHTWKQNVAKRIRLQIIPTLMCGAIFTYCFSHGNFIDFICNYYKFGYWFTICLFGMLFILYSTNYLLYKSSIKKKNYITFVLLGVTFIFILLKSICFRSPEYAKLSDIFCFHQICLYFPFFILGYISSSYKIIFYKFLDNDILQAIIIVCFCILYYIKGVLSSSLYDANIIFLLYGKFQTLIIALFGILIVFNVFRKKRIYFTQKKYISVGLKYIGRHTLEIYLLHYFFLSHIPLVGSFIMKYPNLILELLVGFTFSLFVIGICLFCSNLIKTNSILGRYLLGRK